MSEFKHSSSSTSTPSTPSSTEPELPKIGGRMLMRKESDGGGGIAAAAASDAAPKGGGDQLPAPVREKMEGAFGADLGDVRVHTDGSAKDLNAKAYANGSDIVFDQGQYDPKSPQGQHLLAHELAHVVQQRDGGQGAQAKANDGAVSVSSPGDAAEQAADRAADAVVSGKPVGSVGSAPATTIHRDALGDLKDAADGNWLGSVDDSKVLAKASALSGDDKVKLRDPGGAYDSLNKRIMKKLDIGNTSRYFVAVGFTDMRWMIYWLNQGGRLDDLRRQDWQWLLGYQSPGAMDELRKYPAGYANFLKNAPDDFIPPWDRVQGLVDGTWKGDEGAVRTAVNNLNPAQKTTVRGDQTKVRAIIKHSGAAAEQFRVAQYLQLPVKWVVFYLNEVGAVPQLKSDNWSQMLSECSKLEYDELVGWGDMWTLTQKYCPPSVIQVTRQNTDPATSTKTFDDPVQIDSMFGTLGAAGFLAMATKNALAVDDIYTKVMAKGKVVPTIQGLNKGGAMAPSTKANLRAWMMTAASAVGECTTMFEQRFAVTLNSTDTAFVNYSKPGIVEMWTVCETLPPSAVEGNKDLTNIVRHSGNMSASYNGDAKRVNMGYTNDSDVSGANPSLDTGDLIYQAQPGKNLAQHNIKYFNAALRHEIGHAVDNQRKIMDSWGRQQVAGSWEHHDDAEAFVDAIISAAGGMKSSWDSDTKKKYRKGMIAAAKKGVAFSAGMTENGDTPPVGDPGGPVSVLWDATKYAPVGNPWDNNTWVVVGGRAFEKSYGRENAYHSFDKARRDSKLVTTYQWRAPGEWFAECYMAYYTELEGATAGGAPVGGRLRAVDPEAAQMISQLCDQGFSPQEMTGEGSTNPDGTPKASNVAKSPGT